MLWEHFPADWGVGWIPNSQAANVAGSMAESGGGTSGCAAIRFESTSAVFAIFAPSMAPQK